MQDAFFEPLDSSGSADDQVERYRATSHTEGPWAPGNQHAGPPSALLGRAVERCPARVPCTVARITCEILGPVPVGELTVRAEVVRPGRSVELVEAELTAGGRPVMRASAWRIRTVATGLPAVEAEPAPPMPDVATPVEDPRWKAGYLDALEWRFVDGDFAKLGPATAWARMRYPLVAGEDPSPLQRTLVLADSGNGISSALEIDAWYFINPEITVHLHREPVGDWICLASHSTVTPHGVGLAESTLYDADGAFARGAQSLFVAPR